MILVLALALSSALAQTNENFARFCTEIHATPKVNSNARNSTSSLRDVSAFHIKQDMAKALAKNLSFEDFQKISKYPVNQPYARSMYAEMARPRCAAYATEASPINAFNSRNLPDERRVDDVTGRGSSPTDSGGSSETSD